MHIMGSCGDEDKGGGHPEWAIAVRDEGRG